MGDVKMDEDTRARMMSLMPCSSTGTYEWISDAFREKINNEYVIPEDKWPVFVLRPLTTKEHAGLRRQLLSAGKVSTSSADQMVALSDAMYETVRKLVIGWRGIVDLSTGNEYTYEQEQDGTLNKDKWEMIPDSIKADLFSHVCRVSGLVKKDAEDRMSEVKRGL